MRYLLPFMLALLAFPVLSYEDDDTWHTFDSWHTNGAQELFDAWKAKNAVEIQERCTSWDRRCRQGGVEGNPERTDAPYLSWKTIRSQVITHRMFTRVSERVLERDFPVPWKKFSAGKAYPREHLERWSREHVRKTGDMDISNIVYGGPPPEGFIAPAVNEKGLAVNHDGSLSTGGNDWVRFFWIPLILGVVIGAWKASKGGSPTLWFLGTVVVYAFLTDAKAVLISFAAVWVFVLMATWFAFGVILSGLGFKKGN